MVMAAFTSAFFRCVGDVEFFQDGRTRAIRVRSASRVGYSDLGANRRRGEEIRSPFEALGQERIQGDVFFRKRDLDLDVYARYCILSSCLHLPESESRFAAGTTG